MLILTRLAKWMIKRNQERDIVEIVKTIAISGSGILITGEGFLVGTIFYGTIIIVFGACLIFLGISLMLVIFDLKEYKMLTHLNFVVERYPEKESELRLLAKQALETPDDIAKMETLETLLKKFEDLSSWEQYVLSKEKEIPEMEAEIPELLEKLKRDKENLPSDKEKLAKMKKELGL